MARNIIVTVGISLIRDDILEKINSDAGFGQPLGPSFPNLKRLYTQLHSEDQKVRRSAHSSVNLDEKRWVDACAALAAVVIRLWTHPELSRDKQEQLRFSGAELASLIALHQDGVANHILQSEDRLWLLASDTPSGLFCARVIKKVLTSGQIGLPAFAQTQIQVRKITGLQPYSTAAFVERGLPEAARLLVDHQENALLIGSGGYKGLLPYLGPLATKLGIPILYLYEDSEELLELNPLPVTFDLAFMRRYAHTFSLLNPQMIVQYPETQSGLCRAVDFWDSLRQEAEADFATVQAKIMGLKLIQYKTTLRGEECIQLSATGVLAYILANLNGNDTESQPQQPLF